MSQLLELYIWYLMINFTVYFCYKNFIKFKMKIGSWWQNINIIAISLVEAILITILLTFVTLLIFFLIMVIKDGILKRAKIKKYNVKSNDNKHTAPIAISNIEFDNGITIKPRILYIKDKGEYRIYLPLEERLDTEKYKLFLFHKKKIQEILETYVKDKK
ncbi:MAG: hypothetical protein ACPLVF_02420 [Thermovenabulum sp.]|uniref:hypothetical protein n=1 Tax=Thermovenabulum sp. TaxID=3100335 RepID=UPI003C7D2812